MAQTAILGRRSTTKALYCTFMSCTTQVLLLFQSQLSTPNTWGLVSNNPVSICPSNSELFLKRPTLLYMGPKVLCPLSHSFFPVCQSECEFTHHLCAASSHGDTSSAPLYNNLNLQCVALRNVQLKSYNCKSDYFLILAKLKIIISGKYLA